MTVFRWSDISGDSANPLWFVGERGASILDLSMPVPILRDEQALTARARSIHERVITLDAKWSAARRATVADFVDHIDHMVCLIGIDHVGI